MKEVFATIDREKDRFIEFLKNICSYEATAYDKEELDRMTDYIEEFTRGEGFTVKRTPFERCGDFLTVDINPEGEKSAVLLAHLDTVHPKGTFGTPAVRVEGDKLIAPGAVDCKGGAVMAMLVLRALADAGCKKNVRLILTTDEEISNVLGGEDEMEFFRKNVSGYRAALNCEVTENNEVILSRRGILKYEIRVHGKGGHAGMRYFECRSPVVEAARKIIALESASRQGGNTYSCNIVRAGDMINVVPDECSFTLDVRVADLEGIKEAKELIDKVCMSCPEGITAEAVSLSSRPPFVRNAETEALYSSLVEISEKYGLPKLSVCESGGGSDSAYTQECGVPSLCGLGPSGKYYHTPREYALLHTISERAKLLAAYLKEE